MTMSFWPTMHACIADVGSYSDRCTSARINAFMFSVASVIAIVVAPIFLSIPFICIWGYFLYQQIEQLDPVNALGQAAKVGYAIDPELNPKPTLWDLLTCAEHALTPTPRSEEYSFD